MDGDAWLDDERTAAGLCPACAADDVLPIVYGMPLMDDFQRLQGKVIFAGCCVPTDPPRFTCARCRAEWGSFPDAEPEEPGSVFDGL